MRAEIYEESWWLDGREEGSALKSEFERLLEACGFELFGFLEHYFEPYGYAALWLVGESHLAIHTFHEESKIYIQLSSCDAAKMDLFKAAVESRNG